MPWETTIQLFRHFFTDAERPLTEHEGMTASTFLYNRGAHGLRLVNQVG